MPAGDDPHFSDGTLVSELLDSTTREYNRGVVQATGARGTAAEPTEPAPTVTSVSPATGAAAGGTVVAVNGTNLGGTTSITFGGVAATAMTVVSNKRVNCTTPAHAAGAVNVVAVNPAGNGTGTGAFTYV